VIGARQGHIVDEEPEVTWEDPPAGRKRYNWTRIAEQLREHPGEWAKIFDNDRSSLATAIRIRGIKAVSPEKGFEVRTANNTRGKPRLCTMYLRYNPDKDVNE
jgi:hypothetical protein